MKKFLKSLFRVEENEKKSNQYLRKQISLALEKCKNEKKIENLKIKDIKKWGKDLVFEIFDVPSAYWYEELNEYENIKYHENNLNVSKRLVKKTDKVIEEYREQIKLSITKVDFCNTLINEYEDILVRLDNTIKIIKELKKEESQLKLLNKHKKRLAEMRSDTANFDKIFEKTGKLDLLNDDIQQIEEDFIIRQEVSVYIENLDKEFSEDVENTDSLLIREEINKLTEKIKK